jgi:membrane-bound lytic murein transglycosylase MltF
MKHRRLQKVTMQFVPLIFSDVSYNQGYYRTYKDRQLCKLKKDCNPKIWFNNVEKTCTASKKSLYSGRSPCDISRHHTRDVFKRIIKYYYYYLKDNYMTIRDLEYIMAINQLLGEKLLP